jgi:cyclic-di-AMP phosphodiesterase PgpH
MADWQRLIRKGLISISRSIKHMQHRRRNLGSETKSILATPLAAPRWLFVFFTLLALLLILSSFQEINFRHVGGYIVLSFGFILLLGFYLYRYAPNIFESNNDLIILESVSILIIALAKVFKGMGLSGYLIPLGMVSILMTILVDIDLAILMTVVLDILIALIYQNDLTLFIVQLIGGLIGVFSASSVQQRTDLVRSGLLISVGNILTLVCFSYLLQYNRIETVAYNCIWGIANGFLCGILSIGFLPYFEHMFGISSNIKLLELSDFNQPLLKRLMVEASGTYHHCLLVGNLAQTAAGAIGANALLARVGAYYHDIGKLAKPEYYIENQDNYNRHDDLSPAMSSLIVLSHVKEGIELATKYKLTQEIIDIIEQHHGTSLVYFFYQRALEEDTETTKEHFRYPGPKPQSREAAIILLADAVEAASRTLEDPSYVHIQELVARIINNKFIDGQLEECDLSLKDIHVISEQFSHVLSGIFHNRVEYPDEGKTRK